MLNDQERNNLVNYKYKGGDTSYTYKYVLSPFALWCVDNLTPTWMAPNLITLAGLSEPEAAYSEYEAAYNTTQHNTIYISSIYTTRRYLLTLTLTLMSYS